MQLMRTPTSTARCALRTARLVVPAALALLLSACSSGGASGGGASPSASTGAQPTPAPYAPWGVKTREHVDLWLHSYALLTNDTSSPPLFRRDYRTTMTVTKNRANVLTGLDANREKLAARLATNPDLINGQFLPLYFGSWPEMKKYIEIFVQVNGDPRGAPSQDAAQAIALIAGSFPSAGDREWLRLFSQSVDNESERFYHSYWVQQQRDRTPTLAAVDSLWQKQRPKFQRFLNNTQQADGELLLSLPLDGEGRTVSATKRQNVVTVAFPDRPGVAAEAIYVFAHEVVGALVAQAVNDNTSPAERRSGVAARYQSNGALIAGHLLLQKVAPELAAGYSRYYLGAVGSSAPTLDAQFPLPELMRTSIARQIEIVLGGI
jgi:hypothetical protein